MEQLRPRDDAAAPVPDADPEGHPEAYRWPALLPSTLITQLDPDAVRLRPSGRPRRTVRDWIVDFSAFVAAVLVGMLGLEALGQNPNVSPGFAMVDQVIGALACAAVWLRRRWPVGLAIAMLPVGLISDTGAGAVLVALFTVAVHRPFRYVAWLGGIAITIVAIFYWIRPDPELPYGVIVAFGIAVNGGVIGWGMFVRSRRQLLLSLRDRARRAESEAALRAEQAQRLAREAIAREMHDVLAHRLTLLSVHAGALEFRPGAPEPEIARAAGVIRDSAHEALQDLREIIGVLRTNEAADDAAGGPGATATGPGDESGRPQPTLAALDALVAESRAAGMKVTLDNRVEDPTAVPAGAGRNAYRIAQEGLTNARKHAPGAEVSVVLAGAPGLGLTVDVRNPAPPGEVPVVPGSGQGLIGLTERATLAGGRLTHGTDAEGGFRVTAWLPWG